MAKKVIFPARPDANPTIYAYSDNNPQYGGMLKIGYTIKSAQERVAEQYPILKPGKIPYVIQNPQFAGTVPYLPTKMCIAYCVNVVLSNCTTKMAN